MTILYNDSNPLDTIIAYLRGEDNTSASEIMYVPFSNEEDLKKDQELLKKQNITYMVVNNTTMTPAEFVEHFKSEELKQIPRILQILFEGKGAEYWAVKVAWEHVEHSLDTEDGRMFVKALIESKMYGTETQDTNQQWNALWQLTNLGNTMCLALAQSYRRGGRDGTPFCEFVVNIIEKTETENE